MMDHLQKLADFSVLAFVVSSPRPVMVGRGQSTRLRSWLTRPANRQATKNRLSTAARIAKRTFRAPSMVLILGL